MGDPKNQNTSSTPARDAPTKRYCSPLKMKPLTAEEFRAKTGQKRGVRSHNQAVKQTISAQQQYIDHIILAARERIDQRLQLGIPIDMLTVWNDFDPPTGINFATQRMDLPKWRNLSEYMKFHIAGVCTLAAEGYAFSARLNEELEAQWLQENRDFYELIKRRIAAEFRERGIVDLGIGFAIEGKTKKGTTTGIHLHGFFYFNSPASSVHKVKDAIEAALLVGTNRTGKRRGRDVKIELMYDTGLKVGKTPGRWSTYSSKHALKPDVRLPKRRIYMNRNIVQTAKVMWGLITGAPDGKE